MSPFVDLHLHTTYSDGIISPSEIIKLAAANGVAALAITDHDNADGLEEAFVAAAAAGVKIVSGAEVSTNWYGKVLHILVYGFKPDNAALKIFLNEQYQARKGYFVQKMEKFAPKLVEEFASANGSYFTGSKTAEFLVKNGLFSERDSAADAIYETPAKMKFISPEETIVAAHRAGAVAVLAHPFAPRRSLKNIEPSLSGIKKLIAELKDSGLDGLECFQAAHTPEETELSLEIAADLELLVSGGSDWHGPIEILGEHMRKYTPFYADSPGGLKTPIEAVAPLLERLGIHSLPRTELGSGAQVDKV